MKVRFVAAAVIVALTVGFVGGQLAPASRLLPFPEALAQNAGRAAPLPLGKLREFSEVFQLIKQNYVDEVTDDELIESAMRGMTGRLDPHSAYYSSEELRRFATGLAGEKYGGLGIHIGQRDGWIEIVSPIDDTPAARAGLRAGDLILKIDGVSTRRMGMEDAVNRMRGKVGEEILLEVFTEGEEARAVSIVRAEIVVPSVRSGLIEKGYGYVRVVQFQSPTVPDLVKALNSLALRNEGPLEGIILDLRRNPGGVLTSSIGVAAVFLSEGQVVVTDRGRAKAEKIFTAQKHYYRGLEHAEAVKSAPMVVLVDSGSASAAEIVAGALQDHRRAVLVGIRTYGKASVQQVMHLRSTGGKTGVKLTTARYYTPLGRNIQAKGVEPDVAIAAGPGVEKDENGVVMREADNAGHLKTPPDERETERRGESKSDDAAKEAEGLPQEGDAEKKERRPAFIPRDDFQFDQGLIILKALTVARR